MPLSGVSVAQHAVDVRPGFVAAGGQQRQHRVAHRLGGADAEPDEQIHDGGPIELHLLQSVQNGDTVVGRRHGQGVADHLTVLEQVADPTGIRPNDGRTVAPSPHPQLPFERPIEEGAGDEIGRQAGAFQHGFDVAEAPGRSVGTAARSSAPGLVDFDDERRQPV